MYRMFVGRIVFVQFILTSMKTTFVFLITFANNNFEEKTISGQNG